MESGAADAGRVAPPPRRGVRPAPHGHRGRHRDHRDAARFRCVNVPLVGPKLGRRGTEHWPEAAIGALVVASACSSC